MNLKEKLQEILPSLLPAAESESIKGKELIARVRAVIGDSYSDQTLRSHFSFMALEPDSCLARVPNGQGYYLKTGRAASLHSIFENSAESVREGRSPRHKALALAVRLFDTAGRGVFVYPLEKEDSWIHPDLVAVAWPPGEIQKDGAYVIREEKENSSQGKNVSFRSVCVALCRHEDDALKAFYRTLSSGLWAEERELVLIGEAPEDHLQQLSARFGVGILHWRMDLDDMETIPGADILFRAEPDDIRRLLETLPQTTLAYPRPCPVCADIRPEWEIVRHWAMGCLSRGRVESYEMRVAVN